MVDAMIHQAVWVLFVWVFANQAGVPVPAVPALVAAGALVAGGGPSFLATLAAAVTAAMCADMVWYGIGRWHGARALDVLCRVSHQPSTCADHVEHAFRAHEVAFQFSARFLPALNPFAAGLAGATGIALGRYVVVSGASAVAWAGAWVTAGFLLPDVLGDVMAYLGVPLAVLVALALVAFVAFRYVRRQRSSTAPPRPAVMLGNRALEESQKSEESPKPTERPSRIGAEP